MTWLFPELSPSSKASGGSGSSTKKNRANNSNKIKFESSLSYLPMYFSEYSSMASIWPLLHSIDTGSRSLWSGNTS